MLSIITLLPKLIWLSIIDLIKWLKHPTLPKKNGVWCYVGLYGNGKTLSMVTEAYRLKNKFKYNVYSNCAVTFQDGTIERWQDLLSVPPHSVILLDELPNLLDNYAFKSMPDNLFSLLSQNRKIDIRIMATAQVFDDSVKKFRTLTRYVVECKHFGRLYINAFYNQKEYARGDSVKKASSRQYFVAQDFMYNLYNTLEFIKKLKDDVENLTALRSFDRSADGQTVAKAVKS